jgi:hypothetical protein
MHLLKKAAPKAMERKDVPARRASPSAKQGAFGEGAVPPINETHLSSWEDKPLRFKPNKYPQPLNPDLPRMYFVCLAVGSRGSGKTYSICQLLKQYEAAGFSGGEAMRVILMSPTHDANPVFRALRSLEETDIISDYEDSRLLEVISDIQTEKENTEQYKKELMVYNKYRSGAIDSMTQEDVDILERMMYEKPQKPKYPHGVVNFLILDDLVGSSAFKATGRSALTNLVLKNRHLGVNMLIATQNLKAIPKSIRTNTSLFILFRFASSRIILEDLYEEVSGTLSVSQFEQLYQHATCASDHDFLGIDFTAPKDKRFKRNFRTVLTFTK